MIGQTLGHYRIVEKIGAGGMGVVYRAHDARLDREVALKFLPADSLPDDAARARLLGEARTASGLNHPHICTIYEAGEAEGQTYIAMEHVQGRPLSKMISFEGLPATAVIRYGAQIADALAHAHGHGIIHRDLKCSNVVITPEGRAKVLDFGLARRLEATDLDAVTRSQTALSQTGAVQGTLHYLAPEVLRGAPPDERTDLWAMGVVLYEMAAGHRPFDGRTGFELSSAILRERPAPLPERFPAGLRAVTQRCLEKEPGERYQSALEIRAALEAIGVSTEPVPVVPTRPPARGVRAISRRAWLTIAGAPLVAVLALVAFNVGGWRDRLLGGAGGSRIQSLAVLPLSNLSGDSEQEYFADGMTEALITDLGKISALRVISRTSVMQYKGTLKPLREIAKALKVDAIVEGSVLRSDQRVQITARLIQAAGETQLWSQSYVRDLRDILALQREVAGAIADEIEIQLTPQEQVRLGQSRPVNPEAVEAYFKGRYHWNKRTEEGLKKSLEYFQRATEKDPTYALAYAGLADSYGVLGNNRFLPPEESFPLARQAALKALELDEGLAEAHASLAFVFWNYDWNWSGVERECRRAIELNPGYAQVHHWYAGYLSGMGRHAEAVAEIKKARELDPNSVIINANVGLILYYAREYDRALEELPKAVEMDPNSWAPHLYFGMVYLEKKKYSEAIAAFEKSRELLGGRAGSALDLAHAYAVAGRREEARKLLKELNQQSKRAYVPTLWVARVHVGLGEKAKAFAWLEKAYQERAAQLTWLKVDPRLDPLRAEPRFQELLRRMNFPPSGVAIHPVAPARGAPTPAT